MSIADRPLFVSLVVLLLVAPTLSAQDLAPALAARFSEGVAALKAGQLDAAEAAFRDVLAAGGNRAFVHHNLGIVQQQRQHHARHWRNFEPRPGSIRRSGLPGCSPARACLRSGGAREAVAELDRAVGLLPDEKAAHVQLAHACELAGNVPCLARESRVLAHLAPSDPEQMYRLGKAYLRLSQWAFERIRAVEPRSARLSEALGREYLQQGQLEQALRAYQQAAERDPTLPGIHLALARIHADAGRWDEAAREAELELALVPGSAAALELKARIAAAGAGR